MTSLRYAFKEDQLTRHRFPRDPILPSMPRSNMLAAPSLPFPAALSLLNKIGLDAGTGHERERDSVVGIAALNPMRAYTNITFFKNEYKYCLIPGESLAGSYGLIFGVIEFTENPASSNKPTNAFTVGCD